MRSKTAENAEKPGRPFQNGDDPRRNKKGRPPNTRSLAFQVRQLYAKGREASDLARELKKLTRDPDPRVRLAAIREVMDRVDGRAVETVNLTGDVGLTLADMREITAARRMIDWLKRHHTAKEVAACLQYCGIQK